MFGQLHMQGYKAMKKQIWGFRLQGNPLRKITSQVRPWKTSGRPPDVPIW